MFRFPTSTLWINLFSLFVADLKGDASPLVAFFTDEYANLFGNVEADSLQAIGSLSKISLISLSFSLSRAHSQIQRDFYTFHLVYMPCVFPSIQSHHHVISVSISCSSQT